MKKNQKDSKEFLIGFESLILPLFYHYFCHHFTKFNYLWVYYFLGKKPFYSSLENSTTGIAIFQGSKTSDMRKKISEICSNFDKPDDTESETYIDKVDIINECLENTDVNITNLIEDLGNDVAALGSVPASVYSFLAGRHCSSNAHC